MDKQTFINKYLFKAVGLLVLLGSFGGYWVAMDIKTFASSSLNSSPQAITYMVEPGSSLHRVARDLKARGLISNTRNLVWLARWEGMADSIKAGEYRLEPGITALEFLNRLVSGKVIEYSLTVVEGWQFRQMMQAVHANEYLTHHLEGLNAEQVMARIGHDKQHPEGRFFPDTYHFTRGMSDIAFLQRAHRAMELRLQQEWENRAVGLPYKTSYEALIMASIIEKETAVPAERESIAGVFVRRLEKGMRLQTDPTVIYGLGETFDGNIRRRDLDKDNPYNTYRRAGLPPTPIAMPGAEAIHAALHPEQGTALYFVSKGDGSHYFSSTLEEHNNAVIKYQLKGKKKPFSSMPKK